MNGKLKNFINHLVFFAFAFLLAAVSASGANTKHFRITMTGLTADHQTDDSGDTGERDRDEIVNATGSFVINYRDKTSEWKTPASLLCCPFSFRTGISYANSTPWIIETRPATVIGAPAPRLIFDGDITDGENAVVLVPVLLESDNGDYSGMPRVEGDSHVEGELWNNAESDLMTKKNDVLAIAKAMSEAGDRQLYSTKFDSLGNFGAADFKILETKAYTRPIGMVDAGGERAKFKPQFLVFNYQSALATAQTNGAYGAGAVRVRYEDDARLGGVYTLYFKVQVIF